MYQIRQNQAFTLIELIVVIALISTTLAFAIPRLDLSLFSNPERKLSNWILLNVRSAKNMAVNRQAVLMLNIDLDNNLMWIAPDTGQEDEKAPKNEFRVPLPWRLRDVEYPAAEKKTSGITAVRFYPQGYSDMAVIHLKNTDDEAITFRIEPFLPQVKKYDYYAELQ